MPYLKHTGWGPSAKHAVRQITLLNFVPVVERTINILNKDEENAF